MGKAKKEYKRFERKVKKELKRVDEKLNISETGQKIQEEYGRVEDQFKEGLSDSADYMTEKYKDVEDSVSDFAGDTKDFFEDDLGVDLEVVAAIGLAFVPGMQGYLANALGAIPGVSATSSTVGLITQGAVSGAQTGLGIGTIQQGLNYAETGKFDFEALGYAGLRGAGAGALSAVPTDYLTTGLQTGSEAISKYMNESPKISKFFGEGGAGYNAATRFAEMGGQGFTQEYAAYGTMSGQGALDAAIMGGGLSLAQSGLQYLSDAYTTKFGKEAMDIGKYMPVDMNKMNETGQLQPLSYVDRLLIGQQAGITAMGGPGTVYGIESEYAGLFGNPALPGTGIGGGGLTFRPGGGTSSGGSGFQGSGDTYNTFTNPGGSGGNTFFNNPYGREGIGSYGDAMGQPGAFSGGGGGTSGMPGITTQRIDTGGTPGRKKSGGSGGQSIGSSIPEAEFIESDGGEFGSPGRGGVFGGLDDLKTGDQFVNTDELIASYAQRSLGGMAGAKS